VNLGGFLAPLVTGALGQSYGWHYGFGFAGVGMLVGLIIYVVGAPNLPQGLPRRAAVRYGAGTDAKRVNVDFPAWMVGSLHREARRLGVTRKSLIKLWLAEKLRA
jgi:MFS family permease